MLLCILMLLINCRQVCVGVVSNQFNIVLLADTDRIQSQWAPIIHWARSRIRNDHLLPDNCTFKYPLFPAAQRMNCSVVVQPTCSASDDETGDQITNLDSGDYGTQTAAIDAQWQLRMNGQQVHALVGPPCLTGAHIRDCRTNVQE